MVEMYKILFVLLIFCSVRLGALGSEVDENVDANKEVSARQKRLLFYDEEGNLVKTYTNPFIREYYQNRDRIPAIGYLNPFLGFLKPSFPNQPLNYMVPLSEAVSQQIPNDPLYQNKVFFFPSRDSLVEYNPSCAGKRIQIPSPNSCSNFLNCWDGWAYEQECPQGLMFSNQGYCDYPERVSCQDRKVNRDEPQPEVTCSKEFDTFRNEAQCSEFFVCVNRVPVKFKCPASLAYSQELGVCDYQSRVDCKGSLSISPSTFGQVIIPEKGTSSSSPGIQADDPEMPAAAEIPAAEIPATPELPGASVPPISKPQMDESQAKPNLKLFMMGNSISNTQSWMSSRVAMGRQDAIRQLELTRLAKVKAN